MKVSIKKETREINVRTYIAEDGTEFTSEVDCRKYEAKIQREIEYLQVLNLLVHDNETSKIPCDGGENYENHIWEWYKVSNTEDLQRLNKFFNTDAQVTTYPEFICIERGYDDEHEGYSQTLSNCVDYVKDFFNDFGYTVDVTKQ